MWNVYLLPHIPKEYLFETTSVMLIGYYKIKKFSSTVVALIFWCSFSGPYALTMSAKINRKPEWPSSILEFQKLVRVVRRNVRITPIYPLQWGRRKRRVSTHKNTPYLARSVELCGVITSEKIDLVITTPHCRLFALLYKRNKGLTTHSIPTTSAIRSWAIGAGRSGRIRRGWHVIPSEKWPYMSSNKFVLTFCFLHRGSPAKRAVFAMRKHGG